MAVFPLWQNAQGAPDASPEQVHPAMFTTSNHEATPAGAAPRFG
jgi:hypothetical protein